MLYGSRESGSEQGSHATRELEQVVFANADRRLAVDRDAVAIRRCLGEGKDVFSVENKPASRAEVPRRRGRALPREWTQPGTCSSLLPFRTPLLMIKYDQHQQYNPFRKLRVR